MCVYIDLNQEPAHYNKRMIFKNIYLLDFIGLNEPAHNKYYDVVFFSWHKYSGMIFKKRKANVPSSELGRFLLTALFYHLILISSCNISDDVISVMDLSCPDRVCFLKKMLDKWYHIVLLCVITMWLLFGQFFLELSSKATGNSAWTVKNLNISGINWTRHSDRWHSF